MTTSQLTRYIYATLYVSLRKIFKVVAEIGLKVLMYPHFTQCSNLPVIAICAFNCEGVGTLRL